MIFQGKKSYREILINEVPLANKEDAVDVLIRLLDSLSTINGIEFNTYLKENPILLINLKAFLHQIFEGKTFNLSLTEADILTESSFIPEFKKRLLNKVLPPVEDENTIWAVVDQVVLGNRASFIFLQNLSAKEMTELFELLDYDTIITRKSIQRELIFSMEILAFRAIGNALHVEVVRMVPEYKNFDNPFIALQNELDLWMFRFKKDSTYLLSTQDEVYKQIKIYLRQCIDFVNVAFKNSAKYGISSSINQNLLKIKQQLFRMMDILEISSVDNPNEVVGKSKMLVLKILEYKSKKNNIRSLFRDSTRLISHLITTHTAQTGSHYITDGPKEYWAMFLKACGGGLIVGFLCVLKMMYGRMPGSEFHHAFLYSFNYSMGFVLIYLLQMTLATKQPAMTAATIAQTLTEGKNKTQNYYEFAHFVSKLFRSQFIAFRGNVLIVFPVALGIIYLGDVLFLENYASAKADKLLFDLDFIKSKAIIHACIAGIFLFLSGLISGNLSNNSVYFRIPQRIEKSPVFRQFLGKKNAKSLANFYETKWPGIVSNFWFGVFLGSIGPIGIFLGLDIDIRHITFAAGNLALALYGKGFDVSIQTLIMSIVTVELIGFFNFTVSFGLSLALAFRSRTLSKGETTKIFSALGKYAKKYPLRFIFPFQGNLPNDSNNLSPVKKTSNL